MSLMKKSERYRCGPETHKKQKSFRLSMGKVVGIAGYHARASRYAVEPFLYVDLNAGPGRCIEDGECKWSAPCEDRYGSPLRAMYLLCDSLGSGFRAHFCEADDEMRERLIRNLRPQGTSVTVHDHACFISEDGERRYMHGLVYSDPSNGAIDEPLLRQYAEEYPRVDLLINLACTSHKRQRKLDDYEHIHKIFARIPKEMWFIRRPIGAQQWTMFLGLNYQGTKVPAKDWIPFNSDEGRAVIRHVSLTEEEKRRGEQCRLF